MMLVIKARAVLLWLLVCASITAHADVVVIVHPNNNSVFDNIAISQLFLGQISSFPGGGKAIPVALKRGSDTRIDFNQLALRKSENQYKAFWSRLVFTGKASPPQELENSEAIKDLVANNPALIGYIDSGSADDSVKVVGTF